MDGSDRNPGGGRSVARVIWPSLAFVAGGAGAASYLTTLGVVRAAIGHAAVAFIVAALADPVIVAASADIRDAYRRGAARPRWSALSLGAAIVMTAYLNIMAAWPRDVPSWLVHAWVPVAFLLTLESLMSYTKRGRGGTPLPPGGDLAAAPAAPVTAVSVPSREWLDGHLRAWLADMTPRELEAAIGVSRGRIKSAMTTSAPAPEGEVPGAGVQARPGRSGPVTRPGRPDVPAPVVIQDTPAGAGAHPNGNRPA